MKKSWIGLSLVFFVIGLVMAGNLLAAPGIPITKPPVAGLLNSGPVLDPASTNGQWFMNLTTHAEEPRRFEFYDNVIGEGGGGMQAYAISGYVSRVVSDTNTGAIIEFDIKATVFNDTATTSGQWLQGTNLHHEVNLNTEEYYQGTLKKVKMTADFAISTNAPTPPPPLGPYVASPGADIEAVNEDQLAWYCWNPDEQGGEGGPGQYQVPTWDFGDIPLDQSKSRVLQFKVPGGIPSDGSDPRYGEIMESFSNKKDILLNRTTSLKISQWIDTLSIDTGAPYPLPPQLSSDVSVFFDREKLDYGDAPYDGSRYLYETLQAQNGARHAVVSNVYMGVLIDSEQDGLPTLAADGDDKNVLPDEDGVGLVTPLLPGLISKIIVVASTSGYVNAWFDWGADGSWSQPNDYAIQEKQVVAGTNYMAVLVPTNAPVGSNTYARFRFSTQPGVTTPYGYASDGEVEDYTTMFQESTEVNDFGDAPDSYGTTLAATGAYHQIYNTPVWLGDASGKPDYELDGQPDHNALGDDGDGNDDERGVWIATGSTLIRGVATNYTVIVGGAGGIFQMWVDWDLNGKFDDPVERVADQPLTSGTHYLPITPPSNAVPGMTFARCRISTAGGLGPLGSAPDGEVEDHAVNVDDGYVDWGRLQWPTNTTITATAGTPSEDIYGRCWHAGVTPPSTNQSALVVAQLGYGPDGSDTPWSSNWTWVGTAFNSQTMEPNNDEYVATLTISSTGRYDYAYRFSLNGFDWTYADADGSHNGYTNIQAGDILVSALSPFSITNIEVSATSNTATVWWPAVERVVYSLQFATNLTTNMPAAWSNVGTEVMGPTNSLTDTNAVTPRFYRVVAPYAK